MSATLTAEEALKLVGEIFVYHMPFNRALGLELERYEKDFAQLSFNNQPMMVGNWAQSILHGGVIASALDVAAGLVCVGSTLTRHDTINEDELRQRLSRMGTIDLRVDYLRPGREIALPVPAACYAQATKSPSPVSNCTTKNRCISPAQPPLIWWVDAAKSGKVSSLFANGFSRWMLNRRGRACYSLWPLILFGVLLRRTSSLSLMYRLTRSSLTA
jgi:acyl-coenzyme A thioesterase PaaI-like protein